MEQMEETFMLLALLKRIYQLHCSNNAAVISNVVLF